MHDLLKVEAVRRYDELLRLRDKVQFLEGVIKSFSIKEMEIVRKTTRSDVIFACAALVLVLKTQFLSPSLADLFLYLGLIGLLLGQSIYYRLARGRINSDIDKFVVERTLAVSILDRESPHMLKIFALDSEPGDAAIAGILGDLENELRKKLVGNDAG
jgi:hypothetical protein